MKDSILGNLTHLEMHSGFIDKVHVTRLKKNMLKRIPGQCKQKKISVLSLSTYNGQAMFKASVL